MKRADRNMAVKPESNMAVRPESLENRERDDTRPPAVGAAAELAALRQRIEAAKLVMPSTPHERHCFNCFTFGRDAAIRAILGEG